MNTLNNRGDGEEINQATEFVKEIPCQRYGPNDRNKLANNSIN